MSKAVKQMELDTLDKTFGGVRDLVVLTATKVGAGLDHSFRSSLRGKKVRLQMVKNSLARRVLEKGGIQLDGHWVGTTLLAWGTDSAKELARAVDGALKDAAKKDPKVGDKIKVKTGIADGQPTPLERMKNIPTRLEAIGEVIATILGPAAAIAGCLTGPAAQVASQVASIADKKPEEAPAAAGEPAAQG